MHALSAPAKHQTHGVVTHAMLQAAAHALLLLVCQLSLTYTLVLLTFFVLVMHPQVGL